MWSPLTNAIRSCDESQVRSLLEDGADPNGLDPYLASTPLEFACVIAADRFYSLPAQVKAVENMVRTLLLHGADARNCFSQPAAINPRGCNISALFLCTEGAVWLLHCLVEVGGADVWQWAMRPQRPRRGTFHPTHYTPVLPVFEYAVEGNVQLAHVYVSTAMVVACDESLPVVHPRDGTNGVIRSNV
jgi:hypothetical protein